MYMWQDTYEYILQESECFSQYLHIFFILRSTLILTTAILTQALSMQQSNQKQKRQKNTAIFRSTVEQNCEKNVHATVREKASTTYCEGLSRGTHINGPAYDSAERGATGEKLVVSIRHATLHYDSYHCTDTKTS